MKLRTSARFLIAASFLVSGLVETLGATGLVVEMSPDGGWGSGIHTLSIGGPMQLVGAAVLAFGHRKRWALIILGSYLFLVSVFGNLPLIFGSNGADSALAGLIGNAAVIGGIVYLLWSERAPGIPRQRTSTSMAGPGLASLARLVVCLTVMGGVLYLLHTGRIPTTHGAAPPAPSMNHTLALPVRLLV